MISDIKEFDRLSIKKNINDFKCLIGENENNGSNESHNDKKSITSCSSTSSKVSINLEFNIRDKIDIGADEKIINEANLKETSSRRFSKIEPIVKFSGNLLSFNSILPQNYNRANHSNRRFSRIHKITPMLLNIYEGDINPETKGRDFSISKIKNKIKLKRLSTIDNSNLICSNLLKPIFVKNDLNSRKQSILKVRESISKTQIRMDSIIRGSRALNRKDKSDIERITTKLRDSFKLKINEVMSSRNSSEHAEINCKINISKDIKSNQKEIFKKEIFKCKSASPPKNEARITKFKMAYKLLKKQQEMNRRINSIINSNLSYKMHNINSTINRNNRLNQTEVSFRRKRVDNSPFGVAVRNH